MTDVVVEGWIGAEDWRFSRTSGQRCVWHWWHIDRELPAFQKRTTRNDLDYEFGPLGAEEDDVRYDRFSWFPFVPPPNREVAPLEHPSGCALGDPRLGGLLAQGEPVADHWLPDGRPTPRPGSLMHYAPPLAVLRHWFDEQALEHEGTERTCGRIPSPCGWVHVDVGSEAVDHWVDLDDGRRLTLSADAPLRLALRMSHPIELLVPLPARVRITASLDETGMALGPAHDGVITVEVLERPVDPTESLRTLGFRPLVDEGDPLTTATDEQVRARVEADPSDFVAVAVAAGRIAQIGEGPLLSLVDELLRDHGRVPGLDEHLAVILLRQRQLDRFAELVVAREEWKADPPVELVAGLVEAERPDLALDLWHVLFETSHFPPDLGVALADSALEEGMVDAAERLVAGIAEPSAGSEPAYRCADVLAEVERRRADRAEAGVMSPVIGHALLDDAAPPPESAAMPDTKPDPRAQWDGVAGRWIIWSPDADDWVPWEEFSGSD